MWRLVRIVPSAAMLRDVTRRAFLAAALLVSGAIDWTVHAQSDPLPSWNEGAPKKSIIDFVGSVTREGGPDFVPIPERIAVFDNDGTLWTEQPYYFQLAFAIDRIKDEGGQAWLDRRRYEAGLEGTLSARKVNGQDAMLTLIVGPRSISTARNGSVPALAMKTHGRICLILNPGG
jgi:hypothetical protein